MSGPEAAAVPLDRVKAALDTGAWWGAFDGEQMIGFAGLHRQPWTRASHRAEIGPYYITPAAQGLGAAQALMEALIAEAHAVAITQLELHVAHDNPRAIAFYARFGFAQMGRLPRAVLLDGIGQDDLFLVCALDT